jgi:hypothetical protein
MLLYIYDILLSRTERRTNKIEEIPPYPEAIISLTDFFGTEGGGPTLQGKILRHLCTTANANYKTLTEEIGRDRITILQSIESLIKYHYVEKERDNPQKEKSKLTFLPTLKGLAGLWQEFPFDLKQMIKLKKEDEITRYLEFVRDVFKLEEHQKPMLSRLFNDIKYNYMNLEKGYASKRKLIKDSFAKGMLELVQRRDYDATRLFNEKGVERLKKLYSKEELNEFKELFVRTKQNLTIVIGEFPV